jgi:hypothetical protein
VLGAPPSEGFRAKPYKRRGECSSGAERPPVKRKVAGASPVTHPTGCSAVQQRAWSGTKRFWVRIPPSRFSNVVDRIRARSDNRRTSLSHGEDPGATPGGSIRASVTQQQSVRLLSGRLGVQVPPGASVARATRAVRLGAGWRSFNPPARVRVPYSPSLGPHAEAVEAPACRAGRSGCDSHADLSLAAPPHALPWTN